MGARLHEKLARPRLDGGPRTRQERGDDSDRRQEGADLIDEAEARTVGDDAEQRRADAAQAEREAEEEARHRSDIAGRQLLRVDDDGGEGRGENEADRRSN